jgi:hypothetical protein
MYSSPYLRRSAMGRRDDFWNITGNPRTMPHIVAFLNSRCLCMYTKVSVLSSLLMLYVTVQTGLMLMLQCACGPARVCTLQSSSLCITVTPNYKKMIDRRGDFPLCCKISLT